MLLSITLIIIIITTIISLTGFGSTKIVDDLIFYPPAVTQRGQWWRFITCGLIHADVGHLFFNMLSLYFFGPFVEAKFEDIFGDNGRWFYLAMYITALVISLLPTYFRNKNNYEYRSLGASGAVSAVIFAGLMIAPQTEVYFFFIPIPIPGFIFAPLYLLISAYLDKRGNSGINHSAHIWGSIYGLLFIIIAGRLYGFDAISSLVENVGNYLTAKGWIH